MRAEIAWRVSEGQVKGEVKARDIAQAETMPNADRSDRPRPRAV
ncbi:hypothetical protein J2797_004994 [Paraburkholderia terricola]|uniref:Uncharacterized protein n=1 Tax=Paraburkholderia terricola TaxID=169427 RepID=A0A1M6MWM6_9BURK|nr:hypothetical protein [Paraburkholderia terricola]MDR6495078.1 hypothetical protein [Paraburkholderia terricola]SDO03033.1 hypothetical protein SAMN05192547_100840 [Paraburkholderia sediminicola]SHJ87683.1 hypothetical protein SAMN05192548_1008163 [Paraburkholderia terricola]